MWMALSGGLETAPREDFSNTRGPEDGEEQHGAGPVKPGPSEQSSTPGEQVKVPDGTEGSKPISQSKEPKREPEKPQGRPANGATKPAEKPETKPPPAEPKPKAKPPTAPEPSHEKTHPWPRFVDLPEVRDRAGALISPGEFWSKQHGLQIEILSSGRFLRGGEEFHVTPGLSDTASKPEGLAWTCTHNNGKFQTDIAEFLVTPKGLRFQWLVKARTPGPKEELPRHRAELLCNCVLRVSAGNEKLAAIQLRKPKEAETISLERFGETPRELKAAVFGKLAGLTPQGLVIEIHKPTDAGWITKPLAKDKTTGAAIEVLGPHPLPVFDVFPRLDQDGLKVMVALRKAKDKVERRQSVLDEMKEKLDDTKKQLDDTKRRLQHLQSEKAQKGKGEQIAQAKEEKTRLQGKIRELETKVAGLEKQHRSLEKLLKNTTLHYDVFYQLQESDGAPPHRVYIATTQKLKDLFPSRRSGEGK